MSESSAPSKRRAASFDVACAAAGSVAVPCGAEVIALAQLCGRVLVEDLLAPCDFPFFDSSAMDGWALRAADAVSVGQLAVVGEARAGVPYPQVVSKGAVVAIATGAQLPPGTDAILPIEDGVQTGDRLTMSTSISPGQFVRRAGRQMLAGDVVLSAGARLGAAQVAALAAFGLASATVCESLSVTVIGGGDELKSPGADLPPGSIYDSNTPMLTQLLHASGCRVTSAHYESDDELSVTALLGQAVEASDFVVTCGGVSVGRHDHLPAALKQLEARELITGTTARPGLKFRLAIVARADGVEVPVFLLPGNPLSAWFCFQVYIRRYLAAAFQTKAPRRIKAVLKTNIARAEARTKLVPGVLDQQGVTNIFTPKICSSDAVMAMAGCNAYAIIEPGDGIANKWQIVDCERADG